MDALNTVLSPIHREGFPFIAGFAVATVILFLIAEPLGWAGVVLTAWCVYFFRDPQRVTPVREGLVIAPADGVVCAVGQAPLPAELDMGEGTRPRISIFMNVFDCHVNRAPLDCEVVTVAYTPGKFVNASLDKASEDNERNAIRIKPKGGQEDMAVVQIAGLVARRIVCDAGIGDRLQAGQRFGMIRFGSRVDVYLPAGTASYAAVGQRTVAGETVIADLASDEAERKSEIR